MIETNSKKGLTTLQITYGLIALAVLGIVLMFLFKVDITKYFEFLPDFDVNKEDKVIEDSIFQGGDSGGGGAGGDFAVEGNNG